MKNLSTAKKAAHAPRCFVWLVIIVSGIFIHISIGPLAPIEYIFCAIYKNDEAHTSQPIF